MGIQKELIAGGIILLSFKVMTAAMLNCNIKLMNGDELT